MFKIVHYHDYIITYKNSDCSSIAAAIDSVRELYGLEIKLYNNYKIKVICYKRNAFDLNLFFKTVSCYSDKELMYHKLKNVKVYEKLLILRNFKKIRSTKHIRTVLNYEPQY